VPDQVVSEEKPIPVVGEIALHHVDVMRTDCSLWVSLDEPGVEWQSIVPMGGAPEVVLCQAATYSEPPARF
jgi:hypothetical protein